MKEYEIYIEEPSQDIEEGKEVKLLLKDVENVTEFEAKAVIYKSADLKGYDRLWVRRFPSYVREGPYSIKILERVEKEEEFVPITRKAVPLHKREGYLVKSLLEEEETGG